MKTQYRKSLRAGFSLLELLVTMGIVSVIIVMLASSFRPSDGFKVEIASTQAAQAMERARTVARAMNTEAKVLIHNDPSEPERYLRYILVTYHDLEGGWITDGAGVGLEDGVYFDADSAVFGLGAPVEFSFESPDDSESPPIRWLAYSFSPVGSSENSGAQLSFVPGIVDDGTLEIRNSSRRGGFVLARSGKATMFSSPEQIQATER